MISETPAKPVRTPTLVAHRGYAARFPENTLEGVEAALDAGACYVEVDVQLSADGVPVVIHDARLKRTAGRRGNVLKMPWSELAAVEVNESSRLKEQFDGIRIPTLSSMASLLRKWPRRRAFVEIKRASLEHFGREWVVDRVLEQLIQSPSQFIVISFDIEAVRCAQEYGRHESAWVIDTWTETSRRLADELAPDYLFCNYKKIPKTGRLWPGPWRWVLYEIAEPELALSLAAKGAEFIETMAVGELFDDPELARGKCIDR